MRALVTGAAGFVGSNVVRELLRQGFEVRALIRGSSDIRNLTGLDVEKIEGDVRSPRSAALALKGCRYVFHLAALYSQSDRYIEPMYEVNVEGTKNLLKAAMRADVEMFVHTSTIGTIGRTSDGSLPCEDTPFNMWESSSHYVKSKYLGEQAALDTWRSGLPVVIVHPCAPIGAGDIKPTVTGKRIVDFLAGKMPSYVAGGINFVDVEDVARGHLLAAKKGRAGGRYILGNRNLTLAEFLRLLRLAAGVKAEHLEGRGFLAGLRKHLIRRAVAETVPLGGPSALTCDCTMSVKELALTQTPLELSMEKAVCWFREQDHNAVGLGTRWTL